ncbi:unnamed protein product [Pleuronectes platessa]|uniref:Uncharacterized protein n=1 Tax=Pleuronectes platessa TaxID=8262 RepID=A0A9N7V4P0_PLEPL|nr:unnamed protein product [Pleuronectes platessa]
MGKTNWTACWRFLLSSIIKSLLSPHRLFLPPLNLPLRSEDDGAGGNGYDSLWISDGLIKRRQPKGNKVQAAAAAAAKSSRAPVTAGSIIIFKWKESVPSL